LESPFKQLCENGFARDRIIGELRVRSDPVSVERHGVFDFVFRKHIGFWLRLIGTAPRASSYALLAWLFAFLDS
jgi:hypothetical protein